ncbi:hypothetical protein [Acidiphilium sp. MT5]
MPDNYNLPYTWGGFTGVRKLGFVSCAWIILSITAIDLNLVLEFRPCHVIKNDMKIVSFLLLLIASVSLVSCGATAAQRQYQSDVTITHQSMEALKLCADQIAQSGKYNQLAKHMPITSTHASVLQLADTSYISQQDIPLLSSYEHRVGLCERDFSSNISLVDPEIGSIASQGHQLQKNNAAIFIDGKENWGQFVERRQDISARVYQIMVQIANRDTNELNAENQMELEQRQQALENISRSMQNQEIINQENQPITTNCNQFGNSISCTSR